MSINHTRHSRQVRRGRNVTWSHVVPKCVTNFFAPFLMGSSHVLPHVVLRRVANSTNFASAPGTWAYVVLKCVTDFLTLRSCIKRSFLDASSHFILEALLISHIFYMHIILDKNYNYLLMLWKMIMTKRVWLENSHQKEVEHRTKQSRTHPMTRLTIQFDKTRDTTWYIWIEDNSKKCLIHYQTCKELSSSLVTRSRNPIVIPGAAIFIAGTSLSQTRSGLSFCAINNTWWCVGLHK